MSERPLLVITGAAGYVASLVMPSLRTHHRLRRIDVAEQTATADDELVTADVCDVGLMTEAFQGAEAVIHLAAKNFEDEFLSVLLPRNLHATWAVFEAARRANATAVVFASSGQAVGGYPSQVRVPAEASPRPTSIYGATKVFGEALGRYYADQHGLRVAGLRMGWVTPPDSPLLATEPELPPVWCSSNDLASLLKAILASHEPFGIVNVFSGPALEHFDISNPYGWQPTDIPTTYEQRPTNDV
jgi:uronate dehydrogenase